MIQTVQNEFARLAVIDAYRWWITSDFGFLQRTGILDSHGNERSNVGNMDVAALRLIARTYSVSRNIPSHDQDVEAERVVEAFKKAEFLNAKTLAFAERANKLAAFTEANKVKLKSRADEPERFRKPASAFSKLSWFLRPDDWTIFDKFVGIAVLETGGVGIDQMKAFYDRLSGTWDDTIKRLSETVVGHGFNRFLAFRIADKFLFCHGIGIVERAAGQSGRMTEIIRRGSTLQQRFDNPAIFELRRSLTATETVLSLHLGDKLRNLADDSAPILYRAAWVS